MKGLKTTCVNLTVDLSLAAENIKKKISGIQVNQRLECQVLFVNLEFKNNVVERQKKELDADNHNLNKG